jgi:hypothetical protein
LPCVLEGFALRLGRERRQKGGGLGWGTKQIEKKKGERRRTERFFDLKILAQAVPRVPLSLSLSVLSLSSVCSLSFCLFSLFLSSFSVSLSVCPLSFCPLSLSLCLSVLSLFFLCSLSVCSLSVCPLFVLSNLI